MILADKMIQSAKYLSPESKFKPTYRKLSCLLALTIILIAPPGDGLVDAFKFPSFSLFSWTQQPATTSQPHGPIQKPINLQSTSKFNNQVNHQSATILSGAPIRWPQPNKHEDLMVASASSVEGSSRDAYLPAATRALANHLNAEANSGSKRSPLQSILMLPGKHSQMHLFSGLPKSIFGKFFSGASSALSNAATANSRPAVPLVRPQSLPNHADFSFEPTSNADQWNSRPMNFIHQPIIEHQIAHQEPLRQLRVPSVRPQPNQAIESLPVEQPRQHALGLGDNDFLIEEHQVTEIPVADVVVDNEQQNITSDQQEGHGLVQIEQQADQSANQSSTIPSSVESDDSTKVTTESERQSETTIISISPETNESTTTTEAPAELLDLSSQQGQLNSTVLENTSNTTAAQVQQMVQNNSSHLVEPIDHQTKSIFANGSLPSESQAAISTTEQVSGELSQQEDARETPENVDVASLESSAAATVVAANENNRKSPPLLEQNPNESEPVDGQPDLPPMPRYFHQGQPQDHPATGAIDDDSNYENIILGPYNGLTSDSLVALASSLSGVSSESQVRDFMIPPRKSSQVHVQHHQHQRLLSPVGMASSLLQQAKSLIHLPFVHMSNIHQIPSGHKNTQSLDNELLIEQSSAVAPSQVPFGGYINKQMTHRRPPHITATYTPVARPMLSRHQIRGHNLWPGMSGHRFVQANGNRQTNGMKMRPPPSSQQQNFFPTPQQQQIPHLNSNQQNVLPTLPFGHVTNLAPPQSQTFNQQSLGQASGNFNLMVNHGIGNAAQPLYQQNGANFHSNTARQSKFKSGFYQMDAPKLIPQDQQESQQQVAIPDSEAHEKTIDEQQQVAQNSLDDDANEETENDDSQHDAQRQVNSQTKGQTDPMPLVRQVGASFGVSGNSSRKLNGRVLNEPLASSGAGELQKIAAVAREVQPEGQKNDGQNLSQTQTLKMSQDVTLYDIEVPHRDQSTDIPKAPVSLLDTQVYTIPYTFTMQSNGDAQLQNTYSYPHRQPMNQIQNHQAPTSVQPSNLQAMRPKAQYQMSQLAGNRQFIFHRPQIGYHQRQVELNPAQPSYFNPAYLSPVLGQPQHTSFKMIDWNANANRQAEKYFHYQPMVQDKFQLPVGQVSIASSHGIKTDSPNTQIPEIHINQPMSSDSPRTNHQFALAIQHNNNANSPSLFTNNFITRPQPAEDNPTSESSPIVSSSTVSPSSSAADLQIDSATEQPYVRQNPEPQPEQRTDEAKRANAFEPTQSSTGQVQTPSAFCLDKSPGLYADVSQKCKAYYQCAPTGHQMFKCNNQTQFNQRTQNCDWWYNVDCDGRAGSPSDFRQSADEQKSSEFSANSMAIIMNNEIGLSNASISDQTQVSPMTGSNEPAESRTATVDNNLQESNFHGSQRSGTQSLTFSSDAPDTSTVELIDRGSGSQESISTTQTSPMVTSSTERSFTQSDSPQVENEPRVGALSALDESSFTSSRPQDNEQQMALRMSPSSTESNFQSSTSALINDPEASTSKMSESQPLGQSNEPNTIELRSSSVTSTTSSPTTTTTTSDSKSINSTSRRVIQSEFGFGVQQRESGSKVARSTGFTFDSSRLVPNQNGGASGEVVQLSDTKIDRGLSSFGDISLMSPEERQKSAIYESIYSTSANQGSVNYEPIDENQIEAEKRTSQMSSARSETSDSQTTPVSKQVNADQAIVRPRLERRFGARLVIGKTKLVEQNLSSSTTSLPTLPAPTTRMSIDTTSAQPTRSSTTASR